MDDFGDVVRRARERAGLSQSEVARRAKITQPYLSRVEGGGAEPPSQSVVARIAAALGMPKLRLFIAAGIVPSEVEAAFFESPELFAMLANLSQRQRSAVYKSLKAHYPAQIDRDAEEYDRWLRRLVRRVKSV